MSTRLLLSRLACALLAGVLAAGLVGCRREAAKPPAEKPAEEAKPPAEARPEEAEPPVEEPAEETEPPAEAPAEEAEPPAEAPAEEAKDIVETAMAAGSFKTLCQALTAAGLVETLKGEGPFTVFAPDDDAFAKLPAGALDDLLKPESKDKLKAVLTYHVVAGKAMAGDVAEMTAAKTVQGQDVAIQVKDDTVTVNQAKVTGTDVECSNGVIHVIDAVLMPPEEAKDIVETAMAAGSFKTLCQALTAAGLVETLKGEGPFTVFAPDDDAFAKLPAGALDDLLKAESKDKLKAVLTYHVVAGKAMAEDVAKMTAAKTVQGQDLAIQVKDGTVTVNQAKVTGTDVECSNGVIHVIDAVLMPKSE